VRVLYWDQTGLVLVAKRLEDDRFCWPAVQDGGMLLSPAQRSTRFEEMDCSRVYARHAARTT
jgi:transposase